MFLDYHYITAPHRWLATISSQRATTVLQRRYGDGLLYISGCRALFVGIVGVSEGTLPSQDGALSKG